MVICCKVHKCKREGAFSAVIISAPFVETPPIKMPDPILGQVGICKAHLLQPKANGMSISDK